MRNTGSVPPMAIADTADGFIFCMPSGVPDVAAKDRFADVARFLAIAYNASAIVMVVEAWVRMAKPVIRFDTVTPTSQAPDRKEMVVLMLEDQTRSATGLLPTLREGSGGAKVWPLPGTQFHLDVGSIHRADAKARARCRRSSHGQG